MTGCDESRDDDDNDVDGVTKVSDDSDADSCTDVDL